LGLQAVPGYRDIFSKCHCRLWDCKQSRAIVTFFQNVTVVFGTASSPELS